MVFLDMLAVVAVVVIAGFLVRKYVWLPAVAKARDVGYEKGFADAIKFFGINKFYQANPDLKERRDLAIDELDIPDRMKSIENRLAEKKLVASKGKSKNVS
jgi:hypothetical protein